ncbi:MAG: SSU ribosomal protein S13p (S18e), partial [uncultured Solirubrobacteraceae bacterium]
GSHQRHQHPSQQARRDRPDVHLRHRPPDLQPAPGPGRRVARHLRPRPDRPGGRPAARPHRGSDRRGRPAPRALAEHQAPDRDPVLPRTAPPARPAGPRAEHEEQRAHPQGAQAHVRRRQEEGRKEV